MPCDAMDRWLVSGQSAVIGSHRLRPIEHTYIKGKPLSSQKGQAEAFFLVDVTGTEWILKKFRPGCVLEAGYLANVTSVLPRAQAFMCGTDRRILQGNDLLRARGFHYSPDLDQWLAGTILMPRVKGLDWASLADGLREGHIVLERPQRLTLCRNLAGLIECLEAHQCSHRDLSCGNVFLDLSTGEVYLIDFDSLFHPSLRMPDATTCGTEGYTPSYAWVNGRLDARGTWCEGTDRFALTLLIAEMLVVNDTTGSTGEGGIFDQEELRNRRGSGIDSIVAEVARQYPRAAELLGQAISSRCAADCPGPKVWIKLLGGAPSQTISVSALPDLSDRIADLLNRARPAAPMWPAPPLSAVPAAVPRLPAQPASASYNVTLPPNAWAAPRRSLRAGTERARP